MAFTIRIIRRAVCLRGVSSAYFSQLPELSETWQSVQLKPREAEKNPIVAMNSFTGIPLSTWTFLKTSSAISGFCSDAVWLVWARPKEIPSRHKIIPSMAQKIIRFDLTFMLPPVFADR